jgi:hypothetical protein
LAHFGGFFKKLHYSVRFYEMGTHFHKEKEGRWTFAKEHKYVDVLGVASEVTSGSTASSAVTGIAMTGVLVMLDMPFVIMFHHVT